MVFARAQFGRESTEGVSIMTNSGRLLRVAWLSLGIVALAMVGEVISHVIHLPTILVTAFTP
jgi:hypothetical protein